MSHPVNVVERVRKVLAEVLPGELQAQDIPEDADMVTELGLDSLTAIEFLLRVEDEFDIELDYENLSLAQLTSVRQFSAEVIGRETPA
ncbi:hypothetical protein GCM10018793_23650 [Streptomyces sulfonofaciens]|uniref:Carrier domain-containing protein n=1 Tax=Streptomyces sulfonofaciens TaxID=68272 RepID=A0A919G2I4_9ACTN|nr:acyl carrier protein [Streptomyces sulfonofaciens]GHH76880.1 hypothetical protein GCM10018793_23650 [Streptomyces sulfonofaciens]